MKVRKRLKFGATSFLIVFGGQTLAQAQNSAEASMNITVQVVKGPTVTDKIITDITGQLQAGRPYLSLGDYRLGIPEGTGYSVSVDPEIQMKGSTSTWNLNTSLQKEVDDRGKLTLRLTGASTQAAAAPDHYVGRLTTRVEYH